MSGRRWMGQALPFGTVIESRDEHPMVVLCYVGAPSRLLNYNMNAHEHMTLDLTDRQISFLAAFEHERSEWAIIEDPA